MPERIVPEALSTPNQVGAQVRCCVIEKISEEMVFDPVTRKSLKICDYICILSCSCPCF